MGLVPASFPPDGHTLTYQDLTSVTAPAPPSLRDALAVTVELLSLVRRPATRLLQHRQGQPHRPQHPRDGRRILGSRLDRRMRRGQDGGGVYRVVRNRRLKLLHPRLQVRTCNDAAWSGFATPQYKSSPGPSVRF